MTDDEINSQLPFVSEWDMWQKSKVYIPLPDKVKPQSYECMFGHYAVTNDENLCEECDAQIEWENNRYNDI